MTWITAILELLLKFWNGMKPPVIVTESEKAGSLQQALDTEIKTNEQLKEITETRAAVKPITASELQSPEHAKEVDPDFRDES